MGAELSFQRIFQFQLNIIHTAFSDNNALYFDPKREYNYFAFDQLIKGSKVLLTINRNILSIQTQMVLRLVMNSSCYHIEFDNFNNGLHSLSTLKFEHSSTITLAIP